MHGLKRRSASLAEDLNPSTAAAVSALRAEKVALSNTVKEQAIEIAKLKGQHKTALVGKLAAEEHAKKVSAEKAILQAALNDALHQPQQLQELQVNCPSPFAAALISTTAFQQPVLQQQPFSPVTPVTSPSPVTFPMVAASPFTPGQPTFPTTNAPPRDPRRLFALPPAQQQQQQLMLPPPPPPPQQVKFASPAEPFGSPIEMMSAIQQQEQQQQLCWPQANSKVPMRPPSPLVFPTVSIPDLKPQEPQEQQSEKIIWMHSESTFVVDADKAETTSIYGAAFQVANDKQYGTLRKKMLDVHGISVAAIQADPFFGLSARLTLRSVTPQPIEVFRNYRAEINELFGTPRK